MIRSVGNVLGIRGDIERRILFNVVATTSVCSPLVAWFNCHG